MSNVAELLTPQSSARNTRGRTPVWTPLLNGEEFEVTVTGIEVALMEGGHDSFTLQCQSTELTNTEGLIDSALEFRFGTSPRIEKFQGYITDVTEDSASQGALSFTLTVLGATKRMFEGFPRFWSNKSITSAVRDLANKNMLGYHGTDHNFVWKVLAQTTESDWTFLNKLAKRVGYAVFNRYGVVMCYDPNWLFRESGVYCNLTASDNRDLTTDRILIEFSPAEQSESLQENLGVKYGYFTSGDDVQIGTQPGKFRGYIFSTEYLLRDQDEAAQYLIGLETSMADWKQAAVARVYGDADIYPGMCVNVITTNRRYLRDKYDGKWLVRVVSHKADKQTFQSQMFLTRPSSQAGVEVPPYLPFWQIGSTRAKPLLTLDTTMSIPEAPNKPGYVWTSSWNDRSLRSIL
jgi:hypothetical protein